MSYADELIARRDELAALLARPVAERVAALVATSLLERRESRFYDAAFNAHLNLPVPHGRWLFAIRYNATRTDATVWAEHRADCLLRSVKNEADLDAMFDARAVAA